MLGMARVAGALQKSSDVMKIMSQLVKNEQVGRVMEALSAEMMKVRTLEDSYMSSIYLNCHEL